MDNPIQRRTDHAHVDDMGRIRTGTETAIWGYRCEGDSKE